MLQTKTETQLTLRQSYILPQSRCHSQYKWRNFLFVFFFLQIRYRLLGCSIHEKSNCISAYVATSKYPPWLLCPVSWGCRIHWLHLCRGVRPPPNECPIYDTKQSDGEVPAVLELWGMRSTPSLPLLPGPLWPGVVAPDRALSMG